MKLRILAVTLIVVLAFAGVAMAVPGGKTVEFEGGAGGKVVFDGQKHADAGKKCNDCHTNIFKMKKGDDKITMKDINEGKFCGTCHNGKVAFAATECAKCHKK
ncbi:MAG: cytochrome c3 family protein [Candidatus Magnetoovum sp. WYHC-5]|nr:cytochrome c3 family protein [Candidatus Magnetoovum sp. WYHC-5]